MPGMNQHTGQRIADIAHIKQSIDDILSTPLGTRIMREEYGSLLPDLIDQPKDPSTLLQCYSAIIMAIQAWEKRIVINYVRQHIDAAQPGKVSFVIGVAIITTGMPEYAEFIV